MAYRLRVLFAVLLAFITITPVYAATVTSGTTYDAVWMLTSDMMMANEMGPFTDARTTTANGDGTFDDVMVMGNETTGMWTAEWGWTGNADPFVTNNFTVTNNLAVDQTFIITSTIGVVPIGPSSLTSGSVGGSITDNNGNTATISDNSAAIYTALIDGAAYQTLLDPVFSVTTSAGGTSLFGGVDFGLPPNSQPGPSISTDIGIRMEFILTPGDSVSFTSRFEVQAVPVPAAVWLFGSGLLGLVGIARHKKSA